MKNKKILFLLDDIWSMGKGKGVVSLYNLLKQCDNHNSMTIFTTEKYDVDKDFPNAKIYYFKPIFTIEDKSSKYYKLLLNRLNSLNLNVQYIYKFLTLKNKKYDLLYCSSSIPIYSSILIKKIFNIKTIHRMYGTFLYSKLGNYIEYLKNLGEVLMFTTKADKYIITNDGTYGDKVAKYFNISEKKVELLRNGVNKYPCLFSDKEIYTKYGLEKNIFYILSVSRLVNWKRVDRTIKAMNNIKDKNIVFLVLGEGPEKENLKNMGKKDNIVFLGSKTHNEVRELMKITDIFISMYDLSNVGNPLLEALVEGCAIITYDIGDTASVIDGKNGILIPFSVEEDKIVKILQHSIMELATNDNQLKELKKNAWSYANNNLFDWDTRIKNEINILKTVIES